MAFALCPDDGLPRLWRFVDATTYKPWPAVDCVTVLNQAENTLLINKPLFDQLAPLEQHQVLRTQAPFEFV